MGAGGRPPKYQTEKERRAAKNANDKEGRQRSRELQAFAQECWGALSDAAQVDPLSGVIWDPDPAVAGKRLGILFRLRKAALGGPTLEIRTRAKTLIGLCEAGLEKPSPEMLPDPPEPPLDPSDVKRRRRTRAA